jgi:glycosyltransferase involved in cell wall biosynthesis
MAMKIIIVNYRYFVSGGPERYLFNIEEILEKRGHTVVPFSIKHNKNTPSDYEEYFMSPIGKGDEVYANEYKKSNLKTAFTGLSRMLYSFEAKRKLKKLIKDVKPDIIYVIYYQNKMSASVIDAAYEMKVPVVQRISDFGHICANNIFYIYQKKEICERCLHGSRFNAIKHKCVNNSFFNSFLKVLALKIQDYRKTIKKISAFVIPAEFTGQKFKEFGVPASKIHCIPTFYNDTSDGLEEISYGDFFLYVGRVDRDKGILTLVKAFEGTDYRLVIIGSSIDGYDDFIKNYLADKKHNIVFTGKLDFNEIKSYLKSCLCTVCPSECYDNMPNTVLESYGYKKGVIASRLGALVDLVVENETGLNFTAGDYLDLRSKIKYIFDNKQEAIRFGTQAKGKLLTEYSDNLHYERLLYLFNSLANAGN